MLLHKKEFNKSFKQLKRYQAKLYRLEKNGIANNFSEIKELHILIKNEKENLKYLKTLIN